MALRADIVLIRPPTNSTRLPRGMMLAAASTMACSALVPRNCQVGIPPASVAASTTKATVR